MYKPWWFFSSLELGCLNLVFLQTWLSNWTTPIILKTQLWEWYSRNNNINVVEGDATTVFLNHLFALCGVVDWVGGHIVLCILFPYKTNRHLSILNFIQNKSSIEEIHQWYMWKRTWFLNKISPNRSGVDLDCAPL